MGPSTSNYATRKGQLAWGKDDLGHTIFFQITENLICRCGDQLLKSPDRYGRQRSKATFNRYRTPLSVVHNVASRDWRLLPNSPVNNVPKLCEEQPRCRILEKDERRRLLSA